MKLFKPTDPSIYKNVTCQNCETHFDGKFCPSCGQAVKEYDKPFSFLFYHFTGDFFAFDVRFLQTLKYLIIKPGFLTSEYFAGKRVKYAPPLRVFIFLSFLLFLLLQIFTNKGLDKSLDSEIQPGTFVSVADSLKAAKIPNIYESKTDSVQSGSQVLHINMNMFKDSRSLRSALNVFARELEDKLKTETNPKQRKKTNQLIRLCRNPELAVTSILKYMSWAYFILLPVFALILKLFFIRQRQYYMRHLIFSIHFHSFAFIDFTLIVLLYLAWAGMVPWLASLFVFIIPFYLIRAMKRFYGQRTATIIFKFLGITVAYHIIFMLTAGIVFLKSLGII